MKKIISITLSFVLLSALAFGQAKKPTIMVVPSDNWCITNGFFLEFDNQGTKVKIPDYKRAFQENADLNLVISSLNDMMAERGFPLKNMESAIKTLEAEAAENNMLTSKSGDGLAESPVDALKRVAKADIIMQLTWTVNTTGPKKSVTFNLQGLDSYTDKQIAGAQGTGAPSFSAEVSVLLQEAVTTHIDNFNSKLQAHFEDMFANGREIIIRIKKFGGWSDDLETEFDGKELSAILEEWMAANSVKGRFNTTDATENMMLFEQVRIPLFNEKGNASDARDFAKGLQKFLKNPPYGITSKLMMKGLGQAVIVLGDK